MGSAARRCGAYGGEYLWEGLRLRARGRRKRQKKLVKLGRKKNYRRHTHGGGGVPADQKISSTHHLLVHHVRPRAGVCVKFLENFGRLVMLATVRNLRLRSSSERTASQRPGVTRPAGPRGASALAWRSFGRTGSWRAASPWPASGPGSPDAA
jgi:hypothetical protein